MDTVLDRHGRLVTRYTAEVCPEEAEQALGMLSALTTREDGWRPPSAYDRTTLPLRWAKVSRLGMDVKDLMLARAVRLGTAVFDSDGFTLRSGLMSDPYTGQEMDFTQVPDSKDRLIDLDHVVALADAFDSGGHRWDPAGHQWQDIANDPGNLLAVSGSANRSKGSRNAAAWLPGNDFARRYAVLQVQVKTRYKLTLTHSERAALEKALTL